MSTGKALATNAPGAAAACPNAASAPAAGTTPTRSALIMEGGAMRGMFTCGVMDVLMENGIRFDGGSGISAGAVFGCNYKSRQIGRAIRYNKAYCKDPRYCSLRSLRKTGDLYGVDFCYHELPLELDVFDRGTFAADPMEFYVGATDINTGEAVYHKCSDGGEADFEWMRASASMPLVSRVVEIDGRELLDGGIVDAVPYRFMESLGYNRNVIILTQPKGYRKKKSRALPLVRRKLRKYPKLVEAMADRHLMYNGQMDEIDERERAGAALVIRPPEPLKIGRTEKDPDELERVYQIGRREGLRRLDEVRDWLKERP
jgi:predicted patatin/cPLA2 family phospholipase